MARPLASLLVVAFLVLLQHVRAAAEFSSLPAEQTAARDAAIQAEMQKQNAVDVAVGIVWRNQVVFQKCYGFDDAARMALPWP